MRVDVEEANHLLRLAGSIDVEAGNATLLYHLHCPLNDPGIDRLSRRKTVDRRSIRRLYYENIAPVRLGRFCRQSINAVNVTRVQDGAHRCMNKKLGRPQHVSRV